MWYPLMPSASALHSEVCKVMQTALSCLLLLTASVLRLPKDGCNTIVAFVPVLVLMMLHAVCDTMHVRGEYNRTHEGMTRLYTCKLSAVPWSCA